MASTLAQIAKEKGNNAFKSADYPAAVGHYTAAILADAKDFTLPLNRAAAYLKLGKYDDAERDCSAVLKLSPSNVKALFRRGQARLALGKIWDAQKDLNQAIKIEPANDAVKQELAKAADALEKSKVPLRKTPASVPAPPLASESTKPGQEVHTSAHPKRRRIPITIVEPPASSSKSVTETVSLSEVELLKPVSSRPLAPSTSPSPALPSVTSEEPKTTSTSTSSSATSGMTPNSGISHGPNKPATFRDAKQARDTNKPSRAGGGIFRASGNYTLFEERTGPALNTEATSSSSATNSLLPAYDPPTLTTAPMTSFMFIRSWDSLKDPIKRWKLLTQIPPDSLPSLFQTALEPHVLAAVIQTLSAVLSRFDGSEPADATQARKWVAAYVNALARVPRFATLTLFMSSGEKATTREVLSQLRENGIAIQGWPVL